MDGRNVAPRSKRNSIVSDRGSDRSLCGTSDDTEPGIDGSEPDVLLHYLNRTMTHMIEETARHAGQADILREQIDGVTND